MVWVFILALEAKGRDLGQEFIHGYTRWIRRLGDVMVRMM
jgi:hypothetical protein